jgi:hypothetical protein
MFEYLSERDGLASASAARDLGLTWERAMPRFYADRTDWA